MLNKKFYEDKNIILKRNKIIYINGKELIEKRLNLSLKTIRKQLNSIGFIKPYDNDTYDLYYSERLEHYGLPFMNYIYYLLFFKNLKIPTFKEFVTEYINTYCNQVNKDIYCVKPELNNEYLEFTKNQLIGRIFRSYNSFHRELELFFQFIEDDDLYIEYNFQNDLDGIDLKIKYNNKDFGIASFIGTNKSYQWKNFKNSNRHNYNEKNMINIIAKMKKPNKNCISYNGIYLYAEWFVKKKIEEIKNIK